MLQAASGESPRQHRISRLSSHMSLSEEPGGLGPTTSMEVSLVPPPGAWRVLAEPQSAKSSSVLGVEGGRFSTER